MDELEIIINHYGKEKQIIKAIEEMAELTKELCKTLLGKDDKDNLKFEIADVLIMIEQLMIMYDITEDELNAIILFKTKRTLERIGGEL